MGVCCGACHVELKNEDVVVLDDFNIVRHEGCYDYEKRLDLIYSVGPYKNVQGHFPTFLLNVYREVIAIGKGITPEEITDEDVLASIASIFTVEYEDQ